jgi:hypothetical protein
MCHPNQAAERLVGGDALVSIHLLCDYEEVVKVACKFVAENSLGSAKLSTLLAAAERLLEWLTTFNFKAVFHALLERKPQDEKRLGDILVSVPKVGTSFLAL